MAGLSGRGEARRGEVKATKWVRESVNLQHGASRQQGTTLSRLASGTHLLQTHKPNPCTGHARILRLRLLLLSLRD